MSPGGVLNTPATSDGVRTTQSVGHDAPIHEWMGIRFGAYPKVSGGGSVPRGTRDRRDDVLERFRGRRYKGDRPVAPTHNSAACHSERSPAADGTE